MKRKHTLRSLLSMACAVVMLVTMVPVLPAAAAADVFYDTMESYTVGTDLYSQAPDKYTQTSPAVGHANYTSASEGSVAVVADPTDSNNKVLAVTANGAGKRYILSTVPTVTGDYTLQFDYMPTKAASNTGSGFLDVYLNNGKGHVARLNNKAASTNYWYIDQTVVNSSRVNSTGIKDNTWYSVYIIISEDEYVMEMREKGSSEAMWSVTTQGAAVEGTNVEFCFGPYSTTSVQDTSKPITNYIDNIRITPGVAGAGDSGSTGDDGSVSVSGGGMVSFTDADQIVNAEAVAITAGMGLFAGTTEGKFDPNGTVTRAQMATIIVKMLRGNAFNADNFKGYNKFSDTASFEGGWAEGYINACVQMGVVAGYGDGTFKPGNAVTTAEALTMIINALKVDAGQGDWPTTIMAKAQEMKLYGDLAVKPGTYDALTRDQLAVLTYEGMCYSPKGVSGYKIPGVDIVFTNIADALKVCGDPALITEVVGEDALATKIYGLKTFEGFITENQATTDNEYTTVTSYSADGTSDPVSVSFNMETALGEIGHYVTVYYREEYKNDNEPGVVYNYVDETQVITVDEDITTSKKYKEVFGKSIKEAALANGSDAVLLFTSSYTVDGTRGSIVDYAEGAAAKAGSYLINDGVIKAYMPPVSVCATKVTAVNDAEGGESIQLAGILLPLSNSEDNDQVEEYAKIKKDDYVTYVVVGEGANATYVLTKVKSTKGVVSKTSVNEDGDQVVTVKDKQYVRFSGDNDTGLDSDTSGLNYTDSYTFYVTEDGKYIGYERTEGGLDLNKTVFILGELTVVTKDTYGQKVRKTTARGIDMNGNEVNLLLKVEKNGFVDENAGFLNADADDIYDSAYFAPEIGFYTYELSNEKEPKKEGIYVLEAMPGDYDKDEAPVWTGMNTVSKSNGVQFGTAFTVSSEGEKGYKKGSTVYLLLEGDLNQTTPLTAEKKTSLSTFTNTSGAEIKDYLILSRGETGTLQIEAMVVMSTDVATVTAETVYVSTEGSTPVASNADGYVYDVYDYKTGTPKQITVQDSTLPAGFVTLIPGEGNVYTYSKTNASSDSFSGSASNSATGDGLYSENLLYNQVVDGLTSDMLDTSAWDGSGKTMSEGKKASEAIVVDCRTAKEIADSGLGEFTSMSRITGLFTSNPEIVIVFDLVYSSGSDKLLVVFVKDAFYRSVDGDSTMLSTGTGYVLDGLSVAANCTVTDANNLLNGSNDAELLADLAAKSASGYQLDVLYTVSNGKIDSITVNAVTGQANLDYANGVYTIDGYVVASDAVVTDKTQRLNSSTTADMLAEVFAAGYAEVSYTLTEDTITAVSVNYLLLPGELFFDDFNTYAEGALPLGGGLWNKNSGTTGGSANIVAGGMMKMETTSDSSIRIETATAFEGGYEIKVGFKNDTNRTLAFELPGITVTNGSFSGVLDMRVRASADQVEALYIGGWAYLLDEAGEQVNIDSNSAYTMVIRVNRASETADIELYKEDNSLLGSLTLACTDMSASVLKLEAYGPDNETQSTLFEYVQVTELPEAEEYTITAEPNDPMLGNVKVSRTSAAEGSFITVDTTVRKGYKLRQLLVNDVDILNGETNSETSNTHTFTMPAQNTTVKAVFDAIKSAAVTVENVTTPGNATVTVTGADDLANVEEDTELTVTVAVEDDRNYALLAITVTDGNGDPVAVSEEGTFIMPSTDVTVTASLRQINWYTVAAPTQPANGFGTIALSYEDGAYDQAENQVLENTDVTITATAADGYVAKFILVDGEIVATDPADGKYVIAELGAPVSSITAIFWPEGAYLYDDFGNYEVGAFTADIAEEHGYSEYNGAGTVAIAEEGTVNSGNGQYLSATAGRSYIRLGEPSASYSLEFDFRWGSGSLLDLYLADSTENSVAYFRMRIQRSTGEVTLYQVNGTTTNYLYTDGTIAPSNSAKTKYNLADDTWYSFKITVNAETGEVTVSVKERDNANAQWCTGSITTQGITWYNVCFDANLNSSSTKPLDFDNIVYKPMASN